MDFMEVVDQLADIISRYSETHKLIIGGDMNEDLTSEDSGPRKQYFQEFISDNKLRMQATKPTFVNAKGVEVSTLDYFLYDCTLNDKILKVERLDSVSSNVSDHYPIQLSMCSSILSM